MGFSDIFRVREFKKTIEKLETENAQLTARIQQLQSLEQYTAISDIHAYVEAKKVEVQEIIDQSTLEADQIVQSANRRSDTIMQVAREQADEILRTANAKALEIAGDAIKVKNDAEKYTAIAKAMKNTLEGYGDEYIIPSYSLLDELAEEFGFSDGGVNLKEARAYTKLLIKSGNAATCDYVEANRRETAIRFVVDAFNGKVDSILSKTKHDNYGKLAEQIKDAAILVNANGGAFRNARIVPEYVVARLEELKWAVVVHELRVKQQEEQRIIRERIREEERARKEYERAMKEAKKERDYYSKAMEKAKLELEKATAEQRAKLEGKILELSQKLYEAEEKNKRAVSMAELTRSGNVYVISNVGAFGENVYKIGLTRRLDPLDRIRELGGASVPFSFDVHAIIYSEDAPALETELHKALMDAQMNKVNHRKEFFKTDIARVRDLVVQRGYNTTWTMAAAAQEYRETLEIERRIAKNPQVRAEWERFALKFEDQEFDDELLEVANQ